MLQSWRFNELADFKTLNFFTMIVGRGGALVETMIFNLKLPN